MVILFVAIQTLTSLVRPGPFVAFATRLRLNVNPHTRPSTVVIRAVVNVDALRDDQDCCKTISIVENRVLRTLLN